MVLTHLRCFTRRWIVAEWCRVETRNSLSLPTFCLKTKILTPACSAFFVSLLYFSFNYHSSSSMQFLVYKKIDFVINKRVSSWEKSRKRFYKKLFHEDKKTINHLHQLCNNFFWKSMWKSGLDPANLADFQQIYVFYVFFLHILNCFNSATKTIGPPEQ